MLLSLALGMDCLVVSAGKGVLVRQFRIGAFLMAVSFGLFQAFMPCLTYFVGQSVARYVMPWRNIIACVLLIAIGSKTIADGRGAEPSISAGYGITEILLLSVATSIDALSAGVLLWGESNSRVVRAVAVIGLTSFMMSLFGTAIGTIAGKHISINANYVTGALLIALGVWQVI